MGDAGEAIGAVVGGVIGFFVGGPTGAMKGAALGWSMGSSADKPDSFREQRSSAYSFEQSINTKSQEIPIPVVYGRHKIAGNIIYENVSGANNRYMDMQVGLSEGPVNSISAIKANEVDIIADTRLGYGDQNAFSMNPDEHFPFLAYLSATLDAQKLQISSAPAITSIIEGRLIRVWDSVNSVWVQEQYSKNPAYCLLDFLTHERYGLGLPDSDFDLESFKQVGQYCDELVNGEKRFELDYVIDWEQSALDHIRSILATFRGFLIYSGGKFTLRVDSPQVPSQDFTEADDILEGSFEYFEASKNDIPNRIKVQYIDPDRHWQKVFAQYTDDSDVRNRGKVKSETIKLFGITRFSQAGRMARFYYKKRKYCSDFCRFETGIRNIQCEPGDVITVTHSLPGWTNKEFRVLEITETQEGKMSLFCQEYNEAIYSDKGAVQQVTEETALPNPFEPPPDVKELKVSEYGYMSPDGHHISNINISFTEPDDIRYSHAKIQLSIDDGSFIDRGTADSGEFQLQNIEVGTRCVVKIISVSTYQGIESEGIISNTIVISGKDNKPAAPVSLTVAQQGGSVVFRWPKVPEPDITGYEIRKGSDWVSGEIVKTGATGNRTTSNREIDGTHRYMIKSIDRVGQYSTTATAAIFEVTETGRELNVIEERDELANINNATLTNLDEINGRITFHHMFTLDDLTGYSLDDWPSLDAFSNGLPDFNNYAEYISESIDTGHIGRTGIRLDKDWFFEDSGLSLLSFPNRGLSNFPNHSLENPPAEYDTEIYIRFSDDNVEWSDWQQYLTGGYKFRYVQFKITLEVQTETADFDFNKLIELMDVPDVELELDNINVPVGGTTIDYSNYDYFYTTPVRFQEYIEQDGSTMKYAKFSNKTADSVDVKIYDINNNDVGGTIEKLIIEGY